MDIVIALLAVACFAGFILYKQDKLGAVKDKAAGLVAKAKGLIKKK